MNKFRIFIVIGFLLSLSALWSQSIAHWYTSMGEFEITLREDLMPITTNNFLDLTNSNFYDDLIFHRVIADFMIQDGCPLGTGYGGPGYTIPDEWNPLVNFDDPYVLGMAKTSAPNSAGSQYFITVEPTSWLNENFAAFGHVTLNTDIVEEISEVPTDANDKPLVDVVIDSVRIMTAQFYAFIPEEDSTYATAGDPLVFGMFTNEPDVTYSWFVDELLQTDYDFMFNVSLTVNGWHEITGIGTKNGYDYVKKWWVEITGGTNANDLITTQATLFQNVPNPFNPTTTISFDITSQNSGKTDLIIYDLKGQLVKTLISELLDPGRYNLIWDGTSENGNQVSSGVYFYQLKTGNFTNTKKAVLLK